MILHFVWYTINFNHITLILANINYGQYKSFYRYIDKTLWGNIVNMLLNIESCKNQPNLNEIIENLNNYLSGQQKVVLRHNFTNFKNNVKNY